MKSVWIGCLLFSGLLFAGIEDPEFNVNTRYTVENVVVAGDGWTTNVASDRDGRISGSLRKQIYALVGNKLNPSKLDEISLKLRQEFKARTVAHRVLRGASPEYVQVIFEVKLPSTRF